MSPKQQSKINDLPVECLAGIFDYLDIKNVENLTFVCKKWYEAVKISCTRRLIDIYICDGGPQIDENNKLINFSMFKNIKSIKFGIIRNNIDYYSKSLIKIFRNNCKSLKTLIFERMSLVNSFTPPTNNLLEILIENYCQNLKKFISYDGLPRKYHHIIQKFQQLEWFEVRECDVELPLLKFQQLKTFKYSRYWMSSSSITPKFTRESGIFQSQLINVEIEVLSYRQLIIHINELGDLCPNLQSLKLVVLDKIDGNLSPVLNAIALKFTQLNTLKLKSLQFDSGEIVSSNSIGVGNFMLKLPQIQCLELYPFPNQIDYFQTFFDGYLLETMANVSKNLKILNIGCIDQITAVQFSNLQHMSQLREVYIPDAKLSCRNHIDAHLIGDTIKKCLYLKILKIDDLYSKYFTRLSDIKYIVFRKTIRNQYVKNIKKRNEFKFVTSNDTTYSYRNNRSSTALERHYLNSTWRQHCHNSNY